jgi:proteasome-associated ATPase
MTSKPTPPAESLQQKVIRLTAELETAQRNLVAAQQQAGMTDAQIARLENTLRGARDQIVALKEEVERLAQPPAGFGIFLEANDDDTVDIITGGRKMRVNVSPSLEDKLKRGQEVLLNEAMNVVAAFAFENVGDIVAFKIIMDDGQRALVSGHTDEERVIRLAEPLLDAALKPGDTLLVDRAGFAYEVIPKPEGEELDLEEVPDTGYEDIGGLGDQILKIRNAVELPVLYPGLFKKHKRSAPKGVLLYGPPGCGKTLIAKAVASSLAKNMADKAREEAQAAGLDSEKTEAAAAKAGKAFFLNIKGPELLNKYVGETERMIRMVFQRARDRASEGNPVIVFFDEMESLFRTRGSGVSSDVENTIVPQLLAEIDGVEGLENVVVIGASNREDMIDPAILRPGRLDIKIKVERPDEAAAKDIFSKYLTDDLPLHNDDLKDHNGNAAATVADMIEQTVQRMYEESEENRFLEVTYANGDKEVLYFKDFNSGAMVKNIVDRAKDMSIQAFLADNNDGGIRASHLVAACVDEFKENEDLPNTTNPDDWARISGKKGERIVFIRTLISNKSGADTGKSIDTVINTGQYL